MRDAIDDDVVTAPFGHPHVADLHELGGDAGHVHRVDALDERRGERILHPEEHTNFLHSCRDPANWIQDPPDEAYSGPDSRLTEDTPAAIGSQYGQSCLESFQTCRL